MKYANVRKAHFLCRPNRFIAECVLNGEMIKAHVRNTGRCQELLVPGCIVYLEETACPGRKTGHTLISVEKGGRIINMDSLAPNRVFSEALRGGSLDLPGFSGPLLVKPETRFGDSRFDFYMENGLTRAYAEIKGVTLEENGVALFPDAPTERGVKHIHGLCQAVEAGYCAFLVFIIQMDHVLRLEPNRQTHPAFGEAMEAAVKCGVTLLAYDCRVSPDEIQLGQKVLIEL